MKNEQKKGRIMESNETQTTYERLMENDEFKNYFITESRQLALSESLLEMMEENGITVRELSIRSEVSTSIIQNIRSGKQLNITTDNLAKLAKSLGYDLVLEKGGKKILLNV
jgi:DNA-binding Xre family transcriptional regulator